MLEELLTRIEGGGQKPAIVTQNATHTYGDLHAAVTRSEETLAARGCINTVVGLVADYSISAVAALLALWRLGNITALLTNRVAEQETQLLIRAEARFIVRLDEDGQLVLVETDQTPHDALLILLNKTGEAGFIIFSSGSTGEPKASIHRTTPLLKKNGKAGKSLRSISFLLFDHIGGLNTLLYILFNQGVLVIPEGRRPDAVACAIELHRVQALTTSPSFLNLLLVSGAVERYDLSSIEVVNYGTEPMLEATLTALTNVLPGVRLSQAYGLTETGVVPTRSRDSYSSWVQLGGPDCDVRVVDGLLEVRTKTTMLGYIGLPSPFTEDGYFRTGDAVIQEGEYVRVIGRQSEVINVGGEKIYPAEVENVLRQLPGVVDVTVAKNTHPLVGNVVTACFHLVELEDTESFRRRMFTFCANRLTRLQIPQKITITTEQLYGERLKKVRR